MSNYHGYVIDVMLRKEISAEKLAFLQKVTGGEDDAVDYVAKHTSLLHYPFVEGFLELQKTELVFLSRNSYWELFHSLTLTKTDTGYRLWFIGTAKKANADFVGCFIEFLREDLIPQPGKNLAVAGFEGNPRGDLWRYDGDVPTQYDVRFAEWEIERGLNDKYLFDPNDDNFLDQFTPDRGKINVI